MVFQGDDVFWCGARGSTGTEDDGRTLFHSVFGVRGGAFLITQVHACLLKNVVVDRRYFRHSGVGRDTNEEPDAAWCH